MYSTCDEEMPWSIESVFSGDDAVEETADTRQWARPSFFGGFTARFDAAKGARIDGWGMGEEGVWLRWKTHALSLTWAQTAQQQACYEACQLVLYLVRG